MSNNRTSPGGWVDQKAMPKGPNGRNLCRRCVQEVPKGRRTFCSDECVHQHRLRTSPHYLRSQTFKRDKGVCAACGFDTETLKRIMRHAARSYAQIGGHWHLTKDLAEPLRAIGYRGSGHMWEADHIIPVVEGGGECGLENIRTLCLDCHRQATKDLRARLKQRRALQVPLDFAPTTVSP